MGLIHKICKTNEYCGKSNKTMQDCHQFRHLGHLNFFSQHQTNGTTDEHCRQIR